MSAPTADDGAQAELQARVTALGRLRAEIVRFGAAPYLLTTGEDGRPHAVAVSYDWAGDALIVRTGRRSAANVAARPRVSLLWAPIEAGGYSLIVDGEAALDPREGTVRIQPTRGVLHRAAQPGMPAGGSCTADCVPLFG